ncbi:MAG TPA: alpha-hydroxy acid oxidase, partial [Actinomycetota bacterium]
MDEAPRFLTVDDYEPVAREKLEQGVYDYYAGGAGDEVTLRENVRAFERWVLRPRFLRGSGSPDPSTSVLGTEIAFPLLVAPWAYQWMAHEDGEEGTARAAGDAGTVMVVSSTAVDRLEAVVAAGSGPKWWQLYLAEDRRYSVDMLARVSAAGYGAIVWTVDVPALGLRRRDARNGFALPMGLTGRAASDFEPNLTWDDLAWIREHAPGLPVLVKGLLTAEDARLAVEHGADAIVVSNHGGRQLDRSPAGIDALPEVVEAVAGAIPVLVDGGIRRGLDILTALALGATAALVARPVAWGLAAAGEAGVRDVLRILHDEFVHAMSLTGCRTVDEIGPGLVAPARS